MALFNEVNRDDVSKAFEQNAPLAKLNACKTIRDLFAPACTLLAAKEIVETCMKIPQDNKARAFEQETFLDLYEGARFIAIAEDWGSSVPYRFVKTSSTEARCLTDGDEYHFTSNDRVIRIN